MCLLQFSEQAAIISLNNINQLIVVKETQHDSFVEGTEFLAYFPFFEKNKSGFIKASSCPCVCDPPLTPEIRNSGVRRDGHCYEKAR
jgi:hypothetical protein